jgi:hypothetical protein
MGQKGGKPMTRRTYIATVQIIIDPDAGVTNEAEATDWFSGLLSDNDQVFDWGYLKVGGQYLYPTSIQADPDNYEEGQAL